MYWFPVYEGIFEHAPVLKDAVWLFMWLIARTTDDSDGKGKVLGGIPIPDERPAAELSAQVKTIRRWRRMLNQNGYVSLLRTPYGFRYTLLKSKKWQKPQKRDLPKLPISHKESARIGHRELPVPAERVPETGRESARNGKYKEDNTETTQRRQSAQHTASASTELLKGGVAPLPKPTLQRTKPSGRNINLLGYCGHTDAEIGRRLVTRGDTIAQYLAGFIHISYSGSVLSTDGVPPMSPADRCRAELSQRQCGEMVEKFKHAFQWIEYPLDLSNPLLGHEFCWNVFNEVERASRETPCPPKWEVCERILDDCERTWMHELGEYADAGLPYHPPDFDDHIRKLFERDQTNRTSPRALHSQERPSASPTNTSTSYEDRRKLLEAQKVSILKKYAASAASGIQ